jgi:hypothetical protein
MPRSSTPADLLSTSRALARTVREAQRGSWFPLLLFGLATLASIPVDRYLHRALTCRHVGGGEVCRIYTTGAFVYWPIALVLCYAAVTAFYLRLSRARGVGTPVQSYVVAGIVIALVLTAASIWAAHHPLAQLPVLGNRFGAKSPVLAVYNRLQGPTSAIGLALLVLARVERNWGLFAFTVGYLVIVLSAFTFGWTITRGSPWVFLPHVVVQGAVLLVGAACFALAQRSAHREVA